MTKRVGIALLLGAVGVTGAGCAGEEVPTEVKETTFEDSIVHGELYANGDMLSTVQSPDRKDVLGELFVEAATGSGRYNGESVMQFDGEMQLDAANRWSHNLWAIEQGGEPGDLGDVEVPYDCQSVDDGGCWVQYCGGFFFGTSYKECNFEGWGWWQSCTWGWGQSQCWEGHVCWTEEYMYKCN